MSYSEPPPPPQYGQPPPYGGGQPQGTNKKAVWSLVLGILGVLCCGFFTGIPALILGNMARKEIDVGQGAGRGMATAGLVLGIISIVLGIISVILIATGNFYFNFDTTTS